LDTFIVKEYEYYSTKPYYFFKKMIEDNKTPCNHMPYLVCQDDPKAPGTHRCRCPRSMVWQGDRCVFRLGEKCDDRWKIQELDGSRFLSWDIIYKQYTSEIVPECESGSYCMPGSDVCEIEGAFTKYASVQELADFLKKHIDAELPGRFTLNQ